MKKKSIRVAIVGVGNCASSLLQGIEFYRHKNLKDPKMEALGLMHLDLGGYKPWDIVVGAAFDIDRRKVGNRSRRRSLPDPTVPRSSLRTSKPPV